MLLETLETYLFPRLPYRGLIEAGLCRPMLLETLDFRDFHIAASLKPETLSYFGCYWSEFPRLPYRGLIEA